MFKCQHLEKPKTVYVPCSDTGEPYRSLALKTSVVGFGTEELPLVYYYLHAQPGWIGGMWLEESEGVYLDPDACQAVVDGLNQPS